jgi:bifunctional DNA-binding transcriptional regulator/antitoxin component of YhaV-PrlF toxin-antitoxin module
MRGTNVARLDSKGRILIPSHVRKHFRVKDGTEVILIPDHEKNELRMLPLVRGKSAKIRLTLTDLPDSLASIANILDMNSISIITSESRSLSRNLTEWNLVVDISQCNNGFEDVRQKLASASTIRSVEMFRT